MKPRESARGPSIVLPSRAGGRKPVPAIRESQFHSTRRDGAGESGQMVRL